MSPSGEFWDDLRRESDGVAASLSALIAPGHQPSTPPSTAASKFSALSAWASDNDVTRLAECTHFDRLGVPNFYAVRPSAPHPCAIVNSGKGLTPADAKLSALFECFERWAAEHTPAPVVTTSATTLRAHLPHALVAIPPGVSNDAVLAWAGGFDLLSGSTCFLPVKKVVFPYPLNPSEAALSSNTTGLAAGTDPTETLSSAILEVVERDAVARLDRQNLDRIESSFAPEPVASLMRRFGQAEVDLSIVRCPNPFNIPVFYGLSRDDRMALSSMFCSGSAAHWDPTEALVRTLTEISQSRVAFISTLRDDVGPKVRADLESEYWEKRAELEGWFSRETGNPFEGASALEGSDPHVLLRALIQRIRDASAISVLPCVPLRSAAGLVCYRVYAPELHELNRA